MTQNRFVPVAQEVNQVESAGREATEAESIERFQPVVDDTQEEQEQGMGFFESVADVFTGSGRTTRDIEKLPTIFESGFLRGQPTSVIAKVAPMVALSNDPMEIAQIIQAQIPGVRMQVNKDAQGNIYPILVNEEGKTALVDRPGTDLMNMGQFITQAAAFSFGGGAGSIPGAIAKDVAIESAIQGLQEAVGGEFDAGDVVATGIFAGAGKGLEDLAGAGVRALAGKADEGVEQVLEASKQLDVPVLTSDIYNPQSWATRSLQFTGESVPVIGTGSLRTAQQEAREAAVAEFINLNRGGTHQEIVEGVARRSEKLKKIAGDVYNKINPTVNKASIDSGGVPNQKIVDALDDAVEYLTDPKLSVSKETISMLDDMDVILREPQGYQLLRDNISSYSGQLKSTDPAVMAMPGKAKAKLEAIIAAARESRDDFARAALDEADYRKLKQADSLYGDIARDLKESKIKKLFGLGDMPPDAAKKMLYSGNPAEIRRLYQNLDSAGRSNARSAIITDIVEKLGERSRGEVTPTTLIGELRKRQSTINVFFRGQKKKELDGFIKLLDYTRRAQEVTGGAGSQTAERMLAGGAFGAGFFDPRILAAYGSIGAISRVFESPKVRSIMIRLNQVPPGSPQFRAIAQEASALLRASLQAAPGKGQSDTAEMISDEARTTLEAFQ